MVSTPTITYLEQALSAPALHFNRLRGITPLFRDGNPIIRCTYNTAEAEVMLNERHYLLSMPLKEKIIERIAALEDISLERSRGPLIENHIFYEEMTLVDSAGNKRLFDVVLQEIPRGMMLNEAARIYDSEELLLAIQTMKNRLDKIGFCHKNLKPSNVIICESGIARPLRYWYAEWFDFTNNNIDALLSCIEENRGVGTKHLNCPNSDLQEEQEPIEHEGITRRYKCGRYGFVDRDKYQITKYIYTWASDFREGRAVVSTNNKFGVIDYDGHKVIPVKYSSLEYDSDFGIFICTKDDIQYIFDYNGKKISQKKLEAEELCEAQA